MAKLSGQTLNKLILEKCLTVIFRANVKKLGTLELETVLKVLILS